MKCWTVLPVTELGTASKPNLSWNKVLATNIVCMSGCHCVSHSVFYLSNNITKLNDSPTLF